MDVFDWPTRDRFVNRVDDLDRMEQWWSASTRDALAVIGRRRVGKSWLFRRFAEGKPAILLVADQRLLTTQMARFADTLEPHLGVRPAIDSLSSLFRILYQLGRNEKILAVIDEFPYLVPEGKARIEVLSEVQAVMEEFRDDSQTKIVLCGSLIGQMRSLLAEGSPIGGRLQQLDVWPLTFEEAGLLMDTSDSSEQRITRFSVVGGMARYLDELGRGNLRTTVSRNVLDRRGPLFNDPRVVLDQELNNPATYFSILEELSRNPAPTEHLTNKLGVGSHTLAPYLHTLREMRLITSTAPVGAPKGSPRAKHRVSDGFIRFWFRFVFPNQDGLQDGLAGTDLWDGDVLPYLPDFTASVYEDLCLRYTRATYGSIAPITGGWWGPALNKHRRDGTRTTEEIDVVGAQRSNLKVVGECKWTRGPMPKQALDDLREFKIPAIEQEGRLKMTREGPITLLFARSGFSDTLIAEAETHENLHLVELDDLVAALTLDRADQT
jgi:AAA+ ATPase superfamily predicted ATPase